MTSNDQPVSRVDYDIWGPPDPFGTPTGTPVLPTHLVTGRPRRPWGLGDLGWVVLALLGGQLLITVLAVVAATTNITPGATSEEFVLDLLTQVENVLLSPVVLFSTLAFQWAAMAGVPALASWRKGHRSLAKDYGLTFTIRDVRTGVLFALIAQAVAYAITVVLDALGYDPAAADNTNPIIDATGITLIGLALAAAIGAPVVEEILFRGLFLRAALRRFAKLDLAPPIPGVTDHTNQTAITARRRRRGIIISVALSSIVFGIVHVPLSSTGGIDPLGYALLATQTGLLGAALAVITLRTRRLGAAIIGHALFNSISLTVAFLTP